jgi:ATP-dependent helicase HrpB
MAATLNEAVGETVGYRMRLDTKVGPRTRIEVVTEGVLTRMLQGDPALEGTAALLFDEFHERSLNADLGLALALDAQQIVAPELKLLAMSATLDGARVAKLLGDAAVVECQGRRHEVEIRHVGKGAPVLPGPPGARGRTALPPEPPEAAVTRIVERALAESPGDALVFLPGIGEIRRVGERLAEAVAREAVDVLELHGDLGSEAQDAALKPAAPGRRKLVLATNIAETSLTIDGVRIVVDTGLERRQVFDPVTGMSRRETVRISRASAEQRAGRAGRTAPGVCWRLWSESSERGFAAAADPEILTADLCPLVLDTAVWGTDAQALRWLDPPPAATLAGARDLLTRLGALDAAGRVTAHGRAMQALATHPRLAHMLLRAAALGSAPAAAELAALLSERDLLRGGAARDSDIRSRLEVLGKNGRASAGVSRWAVDRIRRSAQDLLRQLDRGGSATVTNTADPGLLLAFAYPDRIGKRRPGDAPRYQLSNGRGASFAGPESIAREEFIVAVDLDDREREARIFLAAPLKRADLETHFADQLLERDEVFWDSRSEAVVTRRALSFGELVLDEQSLASASPVATKAAFLEGLRSLGSDALPWTDETRDLVARCEFLRKLGIEPGDGSAWPDFSPAALLADLAWLEPWLDGVTRRSHLGRVPLAEALRARLTYAQQRALDEHAPTHIRLPTGTQAPIDYRDDKAPVASMRMQEVFGLAATPRIARGQVPVTFVLLSPARRPLQITRDLASFWKNAYVEVRKDMRGRYPRHYWPEDPLTAEPTRRAKPRGT